jgi:hypothetical protein
MPLCRRDPLGSIVSPTHAFRGLSPGIAAFHGAIEIVPPRRPRDND